jgi:hypothetical protein
MKPNTSIAIATYFGMEVEVVLEMQYYSLVRFRARELIVETADLEFRRGFKCAA